ncbi:ABC transporter ATP-binding protein [Nocardiopsis sp. MG754419]|uniref:ABC transporter ATP-binding protein n=1 Tax=Nocardiopsis sp. MG754419 TaxID=2259865 RepID=UPI001BACF449|nr:ABC transporter ATP-binding protein [Nocardiopsis sp. MG754419]MBR8740239.1 ABC transporter ATP-binding protein [Nocardiopsis sp. MG754419]
MLTTTRTSAPDPPTASAVRVRDLACSYGDVRAVRGVSFDIVPGELFALLGTNGAGKTTTIEALEGFRNPTAGTVRVLGLDPRRRRRALQGRVNAVLQESGTFADLTVIETIELVRRTSGRRRDLDEVLSAVDLTGRAGARVGHLSGGQKRRLDLALAVVTRPEVLLLDEPTTGMDPEARRTVWALIAELIREGTAILLTTHYLEEAERLADRIAVMHHGRIEVAGTLDQVLAGHGDRISFRLEGSPPEDPPVLPGAEAVVEGERVTYTVDGADHARRAHRAMAALGTWADRHRLDLLDLALHRASLEDVFLRVADGHEIPTPTGVSR